MNLLEAAMWSVIFLTNEKLLRVRNGFLFEFSKNFLNSIKWANDKKKPAGAKNPQEIEFIRRENLHLKTDIVKRHKSHFASFQSAKAAK